MGGIDDPFRADLQTVLRSSLRADLRALGARLAQTENGAKNGTKRRTGACGEKHGDGLAPRRPVGVRMRSVAGIVATMHCALLHHSRLFVVACNVSAKTGSGQSTVDGTSYVGSTKFRLGAARVQPRSAGAPRDHFSMRGSIRVDQRSRSSTSLRVT